MEGVALRHVGGEKECKRLMEIVDIAETNVDIKAILLNTIVRPKHMRLVWLWGILVARNFY